MAPIAALSTGDELGVARRASAPARRSACASHRAGGGVRDAVSVETGPEMTVSDERAPVVRVDVLETFVELLTRVEDDGSSDASTPPSAKPSAG